MQFSNACGWPRAIGGWRAAGEDEVCARAGAVAGCRAAEGGAGGRCGAVARSVVASAELKPSVFLSIYEKLESLVQRLPEGLRSPILREITPIKTLFLLQRAPRIVLLGDRAASRSALVNALFGEAVTRADEDAVQSASWQEFARSGRGTLRMLDARRPSVLAGLSRALGAEAPDLYLFLHDGSAGERGLPEDLDHASAVVGFADRSHAARAAIVGVPRDANAATAFDALHGRRDLAVRTTSVVALDHAGLLSKSIAVELPPEAQLEMARLSGNKELQRQIAQIVIKSVTAMCAAVAAQPIPLADFPILTALQASMVASIMHVSGREMNAKRAAEFLAAVGANIGTALALREGARAAVKFVPVWGSAISGAFAATGTYAIGRAAVAFFIDGASIADARGIFRRKRKEKPLLKG